MSRSFYKITKLKNKLQMFFMKCDTFFSVLYNYQSIIKLLTYQLQIVDSIINCNNLFYKKKLIRISIYLC